MTAGILETLDDLGRRGRLPLLARVSATLRFDVTDGERTEYRLVRIDKGDVQVSAENTPADCVLGADRAVFDEVFSGRTSTMAAMLRGLLSAEGDPELLVLAR